MPGSEEILRILFALVSMLLGILMLRYAHKVSVAETAQRLLFFKIPVIQEKEGIVSFNARYGKCLNILALLCFMCGVLFAYIPKIIISLGLAVLVLLIGFIIVMCGYYKACREVVVK